MKDNINSFFLIFSRGWKTRGASRRNAAHSGIEEDSVRAKGIRVYAALQVRSPAVLELRSHSPLRRSL